MGRLGTFEKPLKRHVYFENWVALKSGFDLSNFGFQGWKVALIPTRLDFVPKFGDGKTGFSITWSWPAVSQFLS